MDEAEPTRKRERDRALPRARRPVDRDDHGAIHTVLNCSSTPKKPGKLVPTASAPRGPRLRARRAPPLRPPSPAGDRRVRRTCRRAAGRGRRGSGSPSGVARMCAPIRRSSSTTPSMRSVSLSRSSAAPVTTVSPRAWQAASASSGSSSTRPGTSAGGNRRPDQLRRAQLDVAGGLPADRPSVVDGDARSHPLEDVEQAGAPRIEPDAVDGDVGPRNGHGGDEQRRGGREVTRELDLSQREALGLPDGDALRAAADGCARALEQALGVVPRREGLDDGRLALCEEAGEEHRRLHLRRGHGQLVVDRLQRRRLRRRAARGPRSSRPALPSAAAAPPRAPSAGSRATRRRPARTGRDCPARIPGGKPHERPRVAAVDRRRCRETAQADAVHRERVDVVLVNLDAERADSGDRRLRVRRSGRTRRCASLPRRSRR